MTEYDQAFDGLASNYNLFRPSYPELLLKTLQQSVTVENFPGVARPVIIDVGSGTGISTSLLRAYFLHPFLVLGIEPGRDMLRKAVESTDSSLDIGYLSAQAEVLPFANGTIVSVVAMQSVQWFDRAVFYYEAQRILRKGGVLALVQNNRRWQDSPFLENYESFLETYNNGYSRFYRDFDFVAELQAVEGFEVAAPVFTAWVRHMSVDEFIGMSLSSTKMRQVVVHLGERSAVGKLRDLAEKYCDSSNNLSIPYRSDLYLAHRVCTSRI